MSERTPPHREMRMYTSPTLRGVEVCEARFSGPLSSGYMSESFVIWQLADGANEEWHEGRTVQVDPFQTQLVNPGEFFKPIRRLSEATTDIVISINASLLEGIADSLAPRARNFSFKSFVTKDPTVREAALAFASSMKEGATALEAEACFNDLSVKLVHGSERKGATAQSVTRRRLQKARQYIIDHFDENIRLDELERETGLSKFYLVRQFKECFGLTPHTYLIRLRCARVQKLLRDGLPLQHAATEVGFADQSHLHRHFKKLIGITPGTYAQLTRSNF